MLHSRRPAQAFLGPEDNRPPGCPMGRPRTRRTLASHVRAGRMACAPSEPQQ
jgi:hypothetical protein